MSEYEREALKLFAGYPLATVSIAVDNCDIWYGLGLLTARGCVVRVQGTEFRLTGRGREVLKETDGDGG